MSRPMWAKTPRAARSIEARARTRKLAALALAAALSCCASACRGRDAEVVRVPEDEKVRVGAFMSLTGDTAQYGISALNGIRMAVEEANGAGGVGGRQVELLMQDTRSDAVETEVVVRRLADEHKVHALIGEVVSSRTLAAARVAQERRVPMLTPSSTSTIITAQGDYVFRSCYTDPFQGAALAQFAARSLNARRAGLLVDGGQRYSIELARYIREEFARQGGEVVAEREYREGAGDFSEPLNEIGASQPDVIFVPGYYLEAGLLARQARQLGISVPLLGGDGWDSPRLYEIGGDALDGDFFTSHFSAEDPDPQVRRFVEDYRRLFTTTPDAFAATAYDATRIMLAAIERAPALERAAIRDSLAATREFPGVTGSVTFDASRNALKPVVIIRIGDQGRHTVEAHIAPADIIPPPTPTPTPTPQPRRRRRAR